MSPLQLEPVVVVDSGGANTGSVLHALARAGVRAPLTTDGAVIASAGRVILPGVGTAAQIMATLRATGLVDVIRGLTQPVLGICVGMQVLLERSAEGDVDCLGLLPGEVTHLEPGPGHRVPHMGWNVVTASPTAPPGDPLVRAVDGRAVYFVHSYGLVTEHDAPMHVLATADHGQRVAALVRRGSVWGAQFHPERSGPAGADLLTAFCTTPLEELTA